MIRCGYFTASAYCAKHNLCLGQKPHYYNAVYKHLCRYIAPNFGGSGFGTFPHEPNYILAASHGVGQRIEIFFISSPPALVGVEILAILTRVKFSDMK